MILGPKECEPIVEIYCAKLHGRTQFALDPARKTPRFLGVIATDEWRPHKGTEGWKRNSALLRWDTVKDYLGSTADRMKFSNV